MKVFINDELPTVHNIHGTNGELFKLVRYCHHKSVLILYITENVKSPVSVQEYFGTNNFLFFHWQKHFSFLNVHQVMLCSKTDALTLIQPEDNVYQFSREENRLLIPSTLFLNPLDSIPKQCDLFKRVYSALGTDSDQVVLSLYNTYNFKPNKEPISKEAIIFIHCIHCDPNKLDKVILGLKSIDKNIKIILYNPVFEFVDQEAKLSDFTLGEDGKLHLSVGNTDVQFETPPDYETINKDITVQYRIKTASDVLVHNPIPWKLLFEMYNCNYQIIDTFFSNEDELLHYIQKADIYIPIGHEFSSLYLFSQKSKTYTVFLTDEPVYKEYCVYGKVLGENHSDLHFNMIINRVEKVVRDKDINDVITEYYQNKDNFAFHYSKEIAAILY
jgi:hypothetical protein